MHFCPAIIRRFLVPSARFPKWAQVPFEATGGTLASTDFAPILLGSFCEFTGCKTPDRNLCWKMRRIIFEWMQNSQKWWASQCEEQRGWDFEQNHIITFCWDIGGKHFKRVCMLFKIICLKRIVASKNEISLLSPTISSEKHMGAMWLAWPPGPWAVASDLWR